MTSVDAGPTSAAAPEDTLCPGCERFVPKYAFCMACGHQFGQVDLTKIYTGSERVVGYTEVARNIPDHTAPATTSAPTEDDDTDAAESGPPSLLTMVRHLFTRTPREPHQAPESLPTPVDAALPADEIDVPDVVTDEALDAFLKAPAFAPEASTSSRPRRTGLIIGAAIAGALGAATVGFLVGVYVVYTAMA